LVRLDSLGLATMGTDTGHAPDPPALSADLPNANLAGLSIKLEGNCLDVGGTALTLEALAGAEYRNAHYRCLESPLGAEPQRAARMSDLVV
jgi:hypothetical protein